MKWRFIDLGESEPAYPAAVFEAVMEAISAGLAGDTILFWRPSSPAVYVGYHELVREDVDLDACAELKIPVIRRILGGGPGYCDRNQVIYNVIFKEDSPGMPYGPGNVYRLVLKGLVEALSILGISGARMEERRFGVYVNGKKISGSGQLTAKGVVNASGSFLVDFDYASMKKALKDPVKNLPEGIKEPEDGMTSLRRELDGITIGEAKQALRKGFEEVLGSSYDAALSAREKELASALMEKYLSHEWTFRADIRMRRRNRKPLY